MVDHVHMLIMYSAKVCGFAGGWLYQGKECDPYCQSIMGSVSETLLVSIVLARGYFVSTVGRDEKLIRDYIKHQEQEDKRLKQMKLLS